MPDLLTELTTLDPVAAPLTVRRESLDQLRDAVLASPRKVSRRSIAPLVAAAAVVIAFVFFWQTGFAQSGFGQGDVRAVPAASPSPSVTLPIDTWAVTTPSPLSPRHSSVTAWVDGRFFVIGGTSSGVCPANADCRAPTYLRDAASYDPKTDSWSTIADAPQDVLGFPLRPLTHVATLADTIYVLGQKSLLSYTVGTDKWQQLPSPPGDLVLAFGVSGSSLVAVANIDAHPGELALATLQPDRGTWVRVEMGAGVRGSAATAAVVGDRVVLTSLANSPSASIWAVDTVNPTTGEVGHPEAQKLETFNLEAIGLATSQGNYAVWRGMKKKAWFLHLANSRWTSVDLPKTEGAFVGSSGGTTTYWPVTVSGMVAVRGHLYNPETHLWATTPPMPTGPDSPIVTSGPDLVLSCFGYDPPSGTFGKDCYVLRPAEASLPKP